ncbi:unnamed protein product [Adineta steineri]|uniref:Arrestin C-terminal-like domain-containing protein n=1 Tax=Adineta steineri TaxID=433720 RepID=A0A813WZ06_9BILA|nr:unnamed protein product [Adineta steineri]CAF1432577.1 unnamed protein product [Adineta steineri]
MGINLSKSSLTNTEYLLTLSSTNNFYRKHSIIQGEFYLNARRKLCIEKKIRVDLIGQLIEHNKPSLDTKKSSSLISTNEIFFTYSFPLVTSHQNGIARIIKQQQITFPFRIPLGINLPPSCEFKEFSIVYYLDIYHDGRLLPNMRKKIILAPPTPHINIPLPCKVTDLNNLTMICSLQKSFYSGRDGSIVPLFISIKNFKQNQIQTITVQLIQTISLNGKKHENEIFTSNLNEINENIQENQIDTIFELNLPTDLPPTHIPNDNCQPDNVPSVAITYEFRIQGQINDEIISNLHLSVPIGIE